MEAGSRCTGEDVIPQLQITQTPTSLPLLRCPLGNYGCTVTPLQINHLRMWADYYGDEYQKIGDKDLKGAREALQEQADLLTERI